MSGSLKYLHKGKWLAICLREAAGVTSEELIVRTTSHKHFAGVNVFAYRKMSGALPKAYLIENFRIPAWKTVLELPAGLADHGTSLEENARREVREEIGVG